MDVRSLPGNDNQTTVTEFILLRLSNDPQFQILIFFVFLVFCVLVYFITLVGNGVIMLVIRADSHLHTPMYFFLSHLSFVDICYSSVTVPQMLVNLLAKHNTISVSACFTQIFFFLLSGTCELFILSAMAYDCYAAICAPLHYAGAMNISVCRMLVGISWTMSVMDSLVNMAPLLKVKFCGQNEIGHFSCEVPRLLKLSCSWTLINKISLFSSLVVIAFGNFLLMLVSYIHIISALLRVSSSEGRHKAFSTCSSHFIVVGLLYATAGFQYVKWISISSVIIHQVFSIQYSILTPMLNPIIYSLKNKDVKMAVGRIFKKTPSFHLL